MVLLQESRVHLLGNLCDTVIGDHLAFRPNQQWMSECSPISVTLLELIPLAESVQQGDGAARIGDQAEVLGQQVSILRRHMEGGVLRPQVSGQGSRCPFPTDQAALLRCLVLGNESRGTRFRIDVSVGPRSQTRSNTCGPPFGESKQPLLSISQGPETLVDTIQNPELDEFLASLADRSKGYASSAGEFGLQQLSGLRILEELTEQADLGLRVLPRRALTLHDLSTFDVDEQSRCTQEGVAPSVEIRDAVVTQLVSGSGGNALGTDEQFPSAISEAMGLVDQRRNQLRTNVAFRFDREGLANSVEMELQLEVCAERVPILVGPFQDLRLDGEVGLQPFEAGVQEFAVSPAQLPHVNVLGFGAVSFHHHSSFTLRESTMSMKFRTNRSPLGMFFIIQILSRFVKFAVP
tara:strand:+ start:24059 stop:25279 length:1221 start_codon:yes stop_codon:yes gene_type:complete